MRRWVIIKRETQVYTFVWKEGLTNCRFVNTDKVLPRGTQVEIGLAMRAHVPGLRYDVAVPFVADGGETYWFLPEPAGIDFDDVPGIEDIWIERFYEQAPDIFIHQAEFFAELRRRIASGEIKKEDL